MASTNDKHGSDDHNLSEVISRVDTAGNPAALPKKRFNFWTALSMSVCSSGAWEGWTASIAQGALGGGSVGLVWGWVFVSCGMAALACSLSELISLWPSAGGQYVWAANLASGKASRVLSWYTAWITVAALWLAGLSCGFGVAVQIQAYLVITIGYEPVRWHVFVICLACMICWIIVNIFAVRTLHYLNLSILGLHITGYFIVMGILLGYTDNKHDAKFVFTDFTNMTGWHSDFVSWSVSLLSALYAYLTIDTAVHFGEEIPRANVMIPRAVILQVFSTALMTLPFVIVAVLCIGNIAEVLESPIGLLSPFTQVLLNSTGKVGLAVFGNCLSTTVAMTAGFDLWGASARAVWSLARDQALPPVFARIDKRWKVPIIANVVLIPPSILVFSIYLWNETAFYGIMSGVVAAFQLSYAIPLAINVFYTKWKKPLPKGAYNLGRFSYPIHIVALLFSCFMALFMSFPAVYPVTPSTMNYTSALLGFSLILATVVWFAYGRKHYYGPVDYTVCDGISSQHRDRNEVSA